MKPWQDSCNDDELSTGYQQEELEDLLDVGEFFGVDSRPLWGGESLSVAPGRTKSLPVVVFDAPANDRPLQVKTKPLVVLPTSPYMRPALEIAAARGDVVTSGRDGQHKPNSLHYDGLAIDVRPAVDLAAQVFRYRNAGYRVLTEGLVDPGTGQFVGLQGKAATGKHLHISFDPEGRRV